MKDSGSYIHKLTIPFHPFDIVVIHYISWVTVSQPDGWFSPSDCTRVSVELLNLEFPLAPKPHFEVREELNPSTDVVEDRIVRFWRLDRFCCGEESAEVKVFAKRSRPDCLSAPCWSPDDK